MKQANSRHIIKVLLPFLWEKGASHTRARLLAAFGCLIIGKVIAVWIPYFYKQAIDLLSHPQQLLGIPLFLLITYGSTRMLSTGFIELKEFFFARVEQRAIRAIALKVFKHLHDLSLDFHLDRQTGGLTRALERGTSAIETFLKFTTFNILPTFLEITLVVGTVGYLYGAMLATVSAISIALYIWYTFAITQWRAQFLRKMNEENTHANARAVDSLLNYETVKYFNNESFEYEKYDYTLEKYEQAAVANKIGLSVLNAGQGVIISLGLTAVMILSGQKLLKGQLTLGDFVLIHAYLLQLYQPLNFLGFAYREIKRSLVEMENLFGLLDQPPSVQDKPNAIPIKILHPTIIFEDVHFSYHPDRPILKGISFQVPAGKKVAIVGPSGSGKSTITRLLFRFYDIQSGKILINGQDIQTVTQSSLRQLMGVVPQDMVLFNDTLFYNIHYGNPLASYDQVIKAAKMANLHTFIEKLPLKYDTLVGERGLKLSGGEKQRVAIARALLKHPSIFIFDEATSALDIHTEKEIQANLNDVSHHQTTLMIAHRLSTVMDAHEILVLADGTIVERGTHQDLIKKGNVYAAMWARQSSHSRESDDA